MFKASALAASYFQLLALIGSILGIYYFGINLTDILLICMAYALYTGIGISMMMHRYWSHKSFEFKWPWLKWLFTFFALVLGRGSVIGWVHLHREHHAYSDTEKDPTYPSWKVFFPHIKNYSGKVKKFIVRDLLNREQYLINEYYVLIVLAWILLLSLIDIRFAIYFWFVPAFISHTVLNSFTYFGHKVGYKNYQHRDESRNLWVFGILLWGEGWHNNHHKDVRNFSMQHHWWEIDLISYVIKAVKK